MDLQLKDSLSRRLPIEVISEICPQTKVAGDAGNLCGCTRPGYIEETPAYTDKLGRMPAKTVSAGLREQIYSTRTPRIL